MPDAQAHPQPRVGKIKPHERSHYGRAGITRHSRTRMVLTVSFVLSPVIGLSCHRRLQDVSLTNLTPASRRQDHTTSPSALRALVSSRQSVHRIPRPTFVTIAKRPSYRERDAQILPVIWGRDQLRQIGTTGKSPRHSGSRVAAIRNPFVKGLRVPRKIASLFCRDGASRNDGGSSFETPLARLLRMRTGVTKLSRRFDISNPAFGCSWIPRRKRRTGGSGSKTRSSRGKNAVGEFNPNRGRGKGRRSRVAARSARCPLFGGKADIPWSSCHAGF